ncbi:hypothetical protein SprV_0200871500 [Sparganum proliferum]
MTPPLSICTNARGTGKYATIRGASCPPASPERSSPAFSSIVSTATWSKDYHQKTNVDSSDTRSHCSSLTTAHSTAQQKRIWNGAWTFSPVCAHFGSPTNTDKTVIGNQQPSTAEYGVPLIRVNDAELKPVGNFNYLGGTISRCITIDDGAALRISKASQAFGRLQVFV